MKLVRWPVIHESDMNSVIAVIKRGIFVKGPMATQLEKEFAEYIHVRHCRCVGSCTHAIHLSLRSLGIGPGDEVLVPNLTYCGTVSPIVNCGASPVFVDVDPSTYNLSVSDALSKRTACTKAILPVHLHGYPCDIQSIRDSFVDLPIVEDACQAHGAMRDGERAGSWGDIACFSLNQVKPLCGGQGGLVVTNNEDLWDTIIELASPGMNSTVGLSYEITEMSAALTLSQLDRLDTIVDKANSNYAVFVETLEAPFRKCVPMCERRVRSTWHKLRLRFNHDMREILISALESDNIPYETWPGSLVNQRTEYSTYAAHTPISQSVMETSLILGNETYPFHAQDTHTIIHWAKSINSAL